MTTTKRTGPLPQGAPLTQKTQDAIKAEVARYPEKGSGLLPSLKLAQRELGWLPENTIVEVAALVGVPSSMATELATFYSMLHTEPQARHRVEVCIQLPCALRGAERTVEKLCQGVGLSHPGRTDDDAVEIHDTVECFGACHRAPMARVGDRYVENLDDAATEKLIVELNAGRKNGTPGASSSSGRSA